MFAKSSKTNFGDGSGVTIQFKTGLNTDHLKNRVVFDVEARNRKERRVSLIDRQLGECSDDEKRKALAVERGQWQASIDAMVCPYAVFIFAIGESWDLKEQSTDIIKPFTMESILAIHPTRRQKITFDILAALGYLVSQRAA